MILTIIPTHWVLANPTDSPKRTVPLIASHGKPAMVTRCYMCNVVRFAVDKGHANSSFQNAPRSAHFGARIRRLTSRHASNTRYNPHIEKLNVTIAKDCTIPSERNLYQLII